MTRPLITLETLLHSRPIPWCWAATFMISPTWWLNQEDDPKTRKVLPVWADVQQLLLEVMER